MSDHGDAHSPYEGGISRRGFLQASAAGLATGTLAGSGLAGTALAEDFDRGHRRPPRGRRVLIKGGVVLTMDPAIGDFEQADVLIDGSRIVSVRPNIRASAQVIDSTGMIVMPGFVNTHHHQYETIQRASSRTGTCSGPARTRLAAGRLRDGRSEHLDDGPDRLGEPGHLGPGAFPYDPEDCYISELVASTSQIDAGVTTGVDTSQSSHTPDHTDAMIEGPDGLGRPRAVTSTRVAAPTPRATSSRARSATTQAGLGRLRDAVVQLRRPAGDPWATAAVRRAAGCSPATSVP